MIVPSVLLIPEFGLFAGLPLRRIAVSFGEPLMPFPVTQREKRILGLVALLLVLGLIGMAVL